MDLLEKGTKACIQRIIRRNLRNASMTGAGRRRAPPLCLSWRRRRVSAGPWQVVIRSSRKRPVRMR